MKDTKTCIRLFAFYDRTNLEKFLAEQSEQGWLLTGISLGYEFRRVQPRKRHFCVVYFPKISKDPASVERQQQFWDYCWHSGWALLTANQQMHIFYSELDNPIPIETDPVLEVENIHKSAKKTHLSIFYFELFIGIFQLFMQIKRINLVVQRHSPVGAFEILALVCFSMLILLPLLELISYYLWYNRAKISALHGDFTPTYNHTYFRAVFLLLFLLILLLMPILGLYSILILL